MKKLLAVMRDVDNEMKIAYSDVSFNGDMSIWISSDPGPVADDFIYRGHSADVIDLLRGIKCLPMLGKRIVLTEEQTRIILGYLSL